MPLPLVTTLPTIPYRMADVTAAKATNGYTVAGSFSGCGGSSLGWVLAGFDGRYACEFDDHAAASYAAAFPDTPLDTRSITEVTGPDIEAMAGGPVDVWEGSPPCSKFSTNNHQRTRSWGRVTQADSQNRRMANVEDLFFEWTRILGELRPRAAVAENVVAMLKGKNKGYTLDVLDAIRAHGYQATVWALNAYQFGVPQHRRRAFFVAWDPTRCATPELPAARPDLVTPRHALADLPTWVDPDPGSGFDSTVVTDFHRAPSIEHYSIGRRARTLDLHPGQKSSIRWTLGVAHPDRPCPTLASMELASITCSGVLHWDTTTYRKFSIAEYQRLSAFPDDYPWPDGSTWRQIGARLGNIVPPFLAHAVAHQIRLALDATP